MFSNPTFIRICFRTFVALIPLSFQVPSPLMDLLAPDYSFEIPPPRYSLTSHPPPNTHSPSPVVPSIPSKVNAPPLQISLKMNELSPQDFLLQLPIVPFGLSYITVVTHPPPSPQHLQDFILEGSPLHRCLISRFSFHNRVDPPPYFYISIPSHLQHFFYTIKHSSPPPFVSFSVVLAIVP